VDTTLSDEKAPISSSIVSNSLQCSLSKLGRFGSGGNSWARRLRATRKNRSSDGIPISACAKQSVTTSASVRLRLAFHGWHGQEIVSGAEHRHQQQSRSASIVAPKGRRRE
jgi:hypothetical protein